MMQVCFMLHFVCLYSICNNYYVYYVRALSVRASIEIVIISSCKLLRLDLMVVIDGNGCFNRWIDYFDFLIFLCKNIIIYFNIVGCNERRVNTITMYRKLITYICVVIFLLVVNIFKYHSRVGWPDVPYFKSLSRYPDISSGTLNCPVF